MEVLNSMCKDCKHLHRSCDGTASQVWNGCVLKNASEEEAAAYFAAIEKYLRLEEEADHGSKGN